MKIFQMKSYLHLSCSASKSLLVNWLLMDFIQWIYVLRFWNHWQKIDSTSLTQTPTMDRFPCDLTTYLTTRTVEKMIMKSDPSSSSESKLMHYFKELDKSAVQEFIEHLSRTHCESTFLNFFTYFFHEDKTKRLCPPFVNSYESLVKNPSNSIYDEAHMHWQCSVMMVSLMMEPWIMVCWMTMPSTMAPRQPILL